jgi:hypothetical protein
VTADIDIWRVANLMLKRYSYQAQAESARRTDEIEAAGDHKGATLWRRIVGAVEQLANSTPSGPVH